MLAGHAIMVNLMFLVCSVPIITMGPAWCGLFSSLRFAIRGDGWPSGFKKGLCTGFLRMMVAWIICLGVIIYMAANILTMIFYKQEGYLVPLIMYCLFFLIVLMLTASLIVLNVYIPTSVLQWLKNAITLTFTSPIQTAIVGVLMWVPFAVVLIFNINAIFVLMIFVAIYFTVVVLIATMLLKDALIRVKVDMREQDLLRGEKSEYEDD
jgi:hypothetical protein